MRNFLTIETSRPRFALFFILLITVAFKTPAGEDYPRQRQALVKAIEDVVIATSSYLDKEALDRRVLDAMRMVPRHLFVPKKLREVAYENRPLSIGYGQTISQPYMVAIMTDLLKPKQDHRVLEVGTGSGYQAAVLAQLTSDVFTIEIIEPLGKKARKRLHKLGYRNVQVKLGDGYYGWEEHAPFDAIVVTAAASHVPPPLVKQLKPGGRMVIPVGGAFAVQQLVLIEKDMTGAISLEQVLPVRFVPLTGKRDECEPDCKNSK